jgi:hypothetical protein
MTTPPPMTNDIREAVARIEAYIAAYEDAPSWGGPTMYPAPPCIADLRAIIALLKPAETGEGESFQAKVQPWLLACFGEMIPGDREERNHRFLEEALELVQSCGCTASEAHQLVDYVFGRPVGELHQEVGGVMVTLAALCLANDADMHAAGWVELDRIWGKVEAIRVKQAAKPKHSPLPQAASGEFVTVPRVPTEAMLHATPVESVAGAFNDTDVSNNVLVEALEQAAADFDDHAQPRDTDARLREALRRAEMKLSAYVGVCSGDKELTEAVLPLVRAALEADRGS